MYIPVIFHLEYQLPPIQDLVKDNLILAYSEIQCSRTSSEVLLSN